ncbi:2-succinyl-5-enolpyruvyl-6-hydroxy-3-cyclohexene-1-carboxylic-acid synthase [Photobacterium sp. DNB23_23_1]|uniref:2-succinyl-5-enolpyruvyl-6-hydroxy-3-cyclohexene-1-carboxylate synthase n=1 Tax=Photobacterium pectinilyticum TaxID=2906793 RepID=A0ABT1N4C5_9GAMM|nr:2-succinyl-5-enolpyruvyl-6-hydroxy-3-cyclohexene-1-carboxylic-acid synthase [Photobacterium sp. ZSDE20]MCQ1059402.1 2-succinyl-5-enolpyruvyl-6-hydroxy-3-cyclohexene-1-carboxylic-acid synthase [Photobacterium sp. ZSDE20]MDD1825205.1 2-succinyl-5-enolpyruvyl-6-hydroxy-3-cyclohexene-1-carboxylic-acid synthase [Photobacterium sp. ZSDE20]
MSNGVSTRAALNQLWAGLMLEELVRHGVKHICIAPGSRSTPLTLAAAKNGKLVIHTHFDERGLGFLALGLAKATNEPVAVVVTSGTAVANLLPSVAESGLTGEKLVLLTSDRPVELIDCGANQAIRQHGIFSTHVTAFEDIPSPTQDISPAWLLSTVDKAMYQQAQRGGAVHFNCHYPEPLYGDERDFSDYLQPVQYWQESHSRFTQYVDAERNGVAFDAKQWQDMQGKKGIVIAGRVAPGELAAVSALAQALGWPLLADPQAGGSSDWAGFDVWLQNEACHQHLLQADNIIQFGGRLVSKRLGQFISAKHWQHYWLVDPLAVTLDPSCAATARIQANIADFSGLLTEHTVSAAHLNPNSGWADSLKVASNHCLTTIRNKYSALNEVSLAANMMDWVGQYTTLFLGNSLIVRLLDMCGRMPQSATFANRGASGIDGLIATAAGVQRAGKQPMLCVLGDTSLLYDLNSLALLKEIEQPVVVLVTNNDGGAIFDLLPVPDAQKDSLYRMPHGLSFGHAAAMFGLEYACPITLVDAKLSIENGLATVGTTLIEVQTPAGESGDLLREMFSEIKHATLF